MSAPQHLDDLSADERRHVLKQLEKSRGLVVMASTDSTVETMRIPIFWPKVGAEVLKRDMVEAMTDIVGDADIRTKTLASVFREVWHERNGDKIAQDQETRDSLIVWGNLLIEQTPHKHIVLVETGEAIDILVPIIATRKVFLKWVAEKLPAKLDEIRKERGVGEVRH